MRDIADHMTLKPHTGTGKTINNYGRVTAHAVSDGADVAWPEPLNDTSTTYTPSEIAAQVLLAGSTLRRIADADLQSRTARMLNNAYDLKEDQDGVAQFSSYTSTSLGAAGTVLSPGHMAAAQAQLRIGNNRATPEPAPGPFYAVMHPMQAVPLAGRLIPYATTPAGSTAYGVNTGAHAGVSVAAGRSGNLSDTLIRKGIGGIGEIAGFDVRLDANISVDANDDAVMAWFSGEGLIYVSEVEPRLEIDDSDKSMRGAKELTVWGSYVFGVWRPGAYGLAGTFDASMATS